MPSLAPDRWTAVLATGSLAVAVATGVGAQTGAVDTSSVRWVHHALYATSVATSVLAVVAARGWAQRVARAPTVVVLLGLSRTRGGTPAHAVMAATAAACHVAAMAA